MFTNIPKKVLKEEMNKNWQESRKQMTQWQLNSTVLIVKF